VSGIIHTGYSPHSEWTDAEFLHRLQFITLRDNSSVLPFAAHPQKHHLP